MNVGRFAARIGYSVIGALVVVGFTAPKALAQGGGAQAMAMHNHGSDADQKNQSSELVKAVREATERFRDPAVAEAEGYALQFGCVTGSDVGAMGMHFVKGALVGDDILDPAHPEIVLYEPTADGRLRLTGADFLVLKSVWDAKHTEPPQLMGQLLHLFDAPNRFGLPAFYTLHVWAWKDNPNGTFVNWNPKVACDGFAGGRP
jgi:hypothetical protein